MRRLVLFLILALILPAPVFAQTSEPTLWITWRATNYVPPEFSGRTLPIPGSQLVAGLDVIDGGRVADLSSQTIYWYLNDSLLAGGVGLVRVTFAAPGSVGGGKISLRASIPAYKEGLARTIYIPVRAPEAVVAPLPPGGIFKERTLTLKAAPYYFNIQDPAELKTVWRINGKEPSRYNDPYSLEINLDAGTRSGFSFPVGLRLENPRGSFEFANRSFNLTFKP